MVKLVKSAVKCYKKKTKKNVGGQKKTYEYNQYLVPLKRSDKLDCSMEVFIIPQSDLKDLVDEEGELKDISAQKSEYKKHLAQYETELADLEWKHNQLSKTYKGLFNKYNKARRKQQDLEERVKKLESDRTKLIDALKKERADKKIVQKGSFKGQVSSKELAAEQNKIKENTPTSSVKDDKKDKEDTDLWTSLKSRLTKKEQEEE
ncbi:MAG: hypothetical protein KO316_05290 [Methanobacterium sp.]|jgi:chromosome segregation ATPase|nr:hypothetical protein [Methanobacterium sp.]